MKYTFNYAAASLFPADTPPSHWVTLSFAETIVSNFSLRPN